MRAAKLRKLGRKITPSDLRNPKVLSGFDYVNDAKAGANGHGEIGERWRASVRTKGGTHSQGAGLPKWRGPTRRNPVEAAQDFCDWFNNSGGIQGPVTLATAGHEYVIDEKDTDPEYQAALGVIRDRRAQKKSKRGFVYMMIETEFSPGVSTGGALTVCKVGKSTNPRRRLAEVQAHNPRILALLYVKAVPDMEAEETRLHRKHVKANVLHEWFRPTKELLLEFNSEDRHTDERAYTKREKALAARKEARAHRD